MYLNSILKDFNTKKLFSTVSKRLQKLKNNADSNLGHSGRNF